ncbi:hypothetical protein PENFLA_c039G01584 [Penicillium flavigenum]|uniref:Protein kinase domain-containing protein n=1 Tax=Penicillium flavigenum TaxID=254877 RepID=A0A1V6SL60_9EURO|nr:hypothetical protein PENFLA_c039G01584 [Penicillium flavigenum]
MTSILEWLKRLFDKKLFNLEWLRSLFRRSLKFPVSFPKAGWDVIPADEKVEEEQMPTFYDENFYFPVTIGDILLSRYQAVGKLGWGTTSTVWLVRDLEMNDYKALKAFALDVFGAEESAFYDQMKRGNQQHPGSNRVRTKIGEVKIPQKDWKYYEHLALLQMPLGESLQDLQKRSAGERLDKLSIQSTVYQMLLALDYLHTECHMIHGDIKGDNIFQEIGDETRLDRYVQAELENPSPRNIQSLEISAPPRKETSHATEWNYPVDVWNLGVWAWCAFEGSPLFICTETSEAKRSYSISLHLAQFTGLLGPPPPDFIEPDTIGAEYFDEDGNWVAKDCEVKMTSFEELEKHLEGEDKEMFLDLIKGMITWRPEDRKTPKGVDKTSMASRYGHLLLTSQLNRLSPDISLDRIANSLSCLY